MGADSKHLSLVLQRLSREVRTRLALRRSLQRSISGSLSSISQAQAHSHTHDAEHSSHAEGIWTLPLPQRWQEMLSKQLGLESATASNFSTSNSQDLCPEKTTRPIELPLPAATKHSKIGGLSGRGSVSVRRRRWAALRPASTWDFPTLNSSFPFTIPSIPVGLFLLAHQSAHGNIPSGVMMPPGLNTAARKFHSMSFTRQPGVPIDADEDTNASSFTDTAALSAQILQSDLALRTKKAHHGKPTHAPS
ncbi:hypothetical protein LPJ66_009170, partial [Kickxella alabastrina]